MYLILLSIALRMPHSNFLIIDAVQERKGTGGKGSESTLKSKTESSKAYYDLQYG